MSWDCIQNTNTVLKECSNNYINRNKRYAKKRKKTRQVDDLSTTIEDEGSNNSDSEGSLSHIKTPANKFRKLSKKKLDLTFQSSNIDTISEGSISFDENNQKWYEESTQPTKIPLEIECLPLTSRSPLGKSAASSCPRPMKKKHPTCRTRTDSKRNQQRFWFSSQRTYRSENLENTITDVTSSEDELKEKRQRQELFPEYKENAGDSINASQSTDGLKILDSSPDNSQVTVSSRKIESVSSSSNNNNSNSPNTTLINNELNAIISQIRKESKNNFGKKDTRKCKKGGYVEQMRKVLRKTESDFAFWQHEKETGLTTYENFLKVDEIIESFGISLLRLSDGNREVFITLNRTILNKLQIHVNSELDIDFSFASFYRIDGKTIFIDINKIVVKKTL